MFIRYLAASFFLLASIACMACAVYYVLAASIMWLLYIAASMIFWRESHKHFSRANTLRDNALLSRLLEEDV